MKICVQGLWHLGAVIAACLASIGHDIIGFDRNENTINSLNSGNPTVFEPGLKELIDNGLNFKKLKFVSQINDIDFLWIAYDTPVNDNDEADVDFVFYEIKTSLEFLSTNAIVLISSQMPIGSVKKLEKITKELYPEKNISFSYSPENLRLGNALSVFLKPDRIIVGIRSDEQKLVIKNVLLPITDKIEWMSVESAEMTKHAINSFLATSIVFANEIASICEMTGADAKEVERGLKSEQRIGYKAYLSPGVAFSGGTLARDIEFLKTTGKQYKISIPLLESVKISNDLHKSWVHRKIQMLYSDLSNISITICGITYKAGTNTLRRSLSVELCNWLIACGAYIGVHDPIVKEFPKEWEGHVHRFDNLHEASINSEVLLIGAEWPEYKDFFKNYQMTKKISIIDPTRFLPFLAADNMINYISVGTPLK